MYRVFYTDKISVKISWLMVSGTSRHWTQRRDVKKKPLGNVVMFGINIVTWKSKPLCNVATLKSKPLCNVTMLKSNPRTNVVTLQILLSGTSRRLPERRDVCPNVGTFARTSRRYLFLRNISVHTLTSVNLKNPNVLSNFCRCSS